MPKDIPQRPNLAPQISRGRRCQSCIHWDCGELAQKRYAELRDRDLRNAAQRVLQGQVISPALRGERVGDDDRDFFGHVEKRETKRMNAQDFEEYSKQIGLNYELGDQFIRKGELGICKKNQTGDDFVHFAYLCTAYESRVKVDDDTGDELAEEARNRLGIDS